jgi:very-short-patch-repair endonuclease
LLLKDRARSLRRNSTDAETVLWQQLRNRRLHGFKFRRQVPIGRYIVDFLCEEPAIIIELDGGQHADQADYDETRTDWLRAKGFQVIRFWNNDVIHSFDAVLERLIAEMTTVNSQP